MFCERGADPANIAGSRFAYRSKCLRHERQQIVEFVARSNQYDHPEFCVGKVLLKLKILVGREEDIEATRARSQQQFTVSQPCPTLLLHRTDVMTSDMTGQPTR